MLDHIEVGNGPDARRIAVRLNDVAARQLETTAVTDNSLQESETPLPGLVWLGGYRSDMTGTKAVALETIASEHNMACCRMDYSGHGESGGEFANGTISRWLEEALSVFDHFTKGPQVVIGSSMGAWVAIRLAQELEKRGEASRLCALLLLAPAPDFTHELMLPRLGAEEINALETKGYFEEISEYSDEPNIFTKALIDDGEKNRVMKGSLRLECPVHIIQGMEDPDVPWQHAMKLAEFMSDTALTMTIIRDGDHRLSREEDIARILSCVGDLAGV